MAGLRSASAIPASVSRRISCPTCSSAFARPTRQRRAGMAAWAWAWQSSGTWWNCTAARSGRKARAKGRGPPSSCAFRWLLAYLDLDAAWLGFFQLRDGELEHAVFQAGLDGRGIEFTAERELAPVR